MVEVKVRIDKTLRNNLDEEGRKVLKKGSCIIFSP